MNVLEARRRLLDGEIKKRTAEGENISVRSVSRMKPGLALYGKSEQERTTGAQLVDFVSEADVDGTQNGVTITNNGNGSFTVTGTPTVTEGQVFTYYFARNVVLPDGDYYFNDKIQLLKKDGGPAYPNHAFSYNSETDNAVNFYWQEEIQTYMDGETTYPMLNFGSIALPWEPYTGGAPSPSPDYPQEIKSVGDSGTINVSLSDDGSQSQTLPVQTPNGLPGIPVSSGGNYTDANGQQWICDEMDFKRGVYVQRVGKYIPTGNEIIGGLSTRDGVDEYVFGCETGASKNSTNFGLSNKFKCENKFVSNTFTVTDKYIYFRFAEDTQTPESAREVLNGCEFWYILATSIESPLSPSELSAYAALRTYSPTTVVSNDAGAWMKLGYKTKKSLEVID